MTRRLFSVYGDSISTFEEITPKGWSIFYTGEQREATGVQTPADTWWMQVINHFNGELLANAAWSGCVCEGNVFPQGASERRIAALEQDGKTPDDILIYIGINDYGWGGAKMNADGHGSACPAELSAQAPVEKVLAELAAPGQIDRFKTAYASMLARLRARCPETEIWCVTLVPGRIAGHVKPQFAYDFRGVPFAEYNDAIRAAAHEAGAHVADAFACGMDYEAIEGTHPTARGMRQLAGMFAWSMEHETEIDAALGRGARELATVSQSMLPAELLSEWEDTALWRSAPLCADKPCSFCEHAMAPNNAWLLMCDN